MIGLTVYIVRHCQSVANAMRRYNCTIKDDEGLSDLGRRQAGGLADFFSSKKIDRIYTSPFLRTRQTAAAIAASTKAEIEIVDDFRELDCGAWSGKGEDDIMDRFPEAWKGWHYDPQNNPIPGGESLLQVQARVLPRFGELARRHEGGDFMIVTHYCVMNVLLCSLVSSLASFRSFRSVNGAVAELSLENVPKLISFRPL